MHAARVNKHLILKQKGRLVRPFFVGSDARAAIYAQRGVDSSCMVGRSRLHEHDPRVRRRYWAVLNARRYHNHLAGPYMLNRITKPHLQRPLHDIKQFIFLVMRMPNKLPFNLRQLDLLTIQLGHHVWGPLGVNQSVLVAEVDGFHGRYG